MFLTILFVLNSCSSDKLIEVTYNDYKKDTIMVNAFSFQFENTTLIATRNRFDGGPYIVSKNLKYYRILK